VPARNAHEANPGSILARPAGRALPRARSSGGATYPRRRCCQGLLLVPNTMHFVDQRSDRRSVLLAGVDHALDALGLSFVNNDTGSQQKAALAGGVSHKLLHVLLNLLGCAREEQ